MISITCTPPLNNKVFEENVDCIYGSSFNYYLESIYNSVVVEINDIEVGKIATSTEIICEIKERWNRLSLSERIKWNTFALAKKFYPWIHGQRLCI